MKVDLDPEYLENIFSRSLTKTTHHRKLKNKHLVFMREREKIFSKYSGPYILLLYNESSVCQSQFANQVKVCKVSWKHIFLTFPACY